jgi:hypothetical protein
MVNVNIIYCGGSAGATYTTPAAYPSGGLAEKRSPQVLADLWDRRIDETQPLDQPVGPAVGQSHWIDDGRLPVRVASESAHEDGDAFTLTPPISELPTAVGTDRRRPPEHADAAGLRSERRQRAVDGVGGRAALVSPA